MIRGPYEPFANAFRERLGFTVREDLVYRKQGLDANGTNRYVISCLQIALRRAERHVDADGTPKTFFLYEGGLL